MKKILVIDNYDSFVYNLVHYLEELDCEVTVIRNDQLELEDVEKYDKILLSPGPGIPSEAGLLKPIIEKYASSKSILGVCLGQQAIGEVFGGTLGNLESVYHGIATTMDLCVDDEPLFKDLPKTMKVGRYHSWVVLKELPDSLEATSYDEKGQIMSLRHREFDVRGVQFHPESVLTPDGKKMIQNWVESPSPTLPKGEGAHT
ncbi:anthranilate synthase component II [Salegentibacter mishustinae]|jgi:anthranilate synthase component 2|uniref:Anthranilate synthase subunit II n=1 Tax=Salegentibacter mishustinae TaxID=270918 RepID=A0A0Q9ZP92_9FLAO|nr:aminodeoxychorismate/anthranilate synthase component II [Salegentibacter mishustinae]KRG30360.1 anthranilate synthase subunit II [Salegentibacter mishustinae]PNW23256.1 anthranilate synthase subunit II [Salegentibacter mishustinae]PZX66316.1 anthranilate synthase component 2 [Salegentibacter mishustinae]GGW81815.1 aminodeoxychorismate/anthranilate synthase component II [Salegentibacter mishustinae]